MRQLRRRARGAPRAARARRTRVAVSADGSAWFLLNASPEIRAQIEGFAGLWPRGRATRRSPAICSTNGDLDHCLGLLSLRESQPLVLYATAPCAAASARNNVLYRTLERFPGSSVAAARARACVPLVDPDGAASGLSSTACPSPGKLPVHLERSATPSPEDNVGLSIRDARAGSTLAYLSASRRRRLRSMRARRRRRLRLLRRHVLAQRRALAAGPRTRARRGHGALAHRRAGRQPRVLWRGCPAASSTSTSTTPTRCLREDSPSARRCDAAGVEIAFDGMEIEL